MIIKKKRINKTDKILAIIGEKDFRIRANTDSKELLERIGFNDLSIGKSIVPLEIDTITRFNRNGKEIIAIPKEKEVVVHNVEYNIKDWHGNPKSGDYDRQYKRYKRVFIAAPMEKVSITDIKENIYTISSDILNITMGNDKIKTYINILLEIFGYVELVDEQDEPFITSKRVSWKILPPGDYPWEEFSKSIQPVIRRTNDEDLREIKDRYEFIKSLKPNAIFTGEDGFMGYYIAEFGDNIYICDSVFLNNAIYILGNDWENISKMTKKEIINGSYAKARIIHSGDWKKQILKYV